MSRQIQAKRYYIQLNRCSTTVDHTKSVCIYLTNTHTRKTHSIRKKNKSSMRINAAHAHTMQCTQQFQSSIVVSDFSSSNQRYLGIMKIYGYTPQHKIQKEFKKLLLRCTVRIILSIIVCQRFI